MGHCSPSSDLYSLGVTAVVLLTGKAPEVLMDRYSLEWQWRNYTSVGPLLAQVLDKLLADKPKNRYQSAKDVLADFHQTTSLAATVVSPAPIGQALNLAPTVVRQTPIDPSLNPLANETKLETRQCTSLNPAFIKLCQQELTNYIGPIATFLIKEVLSQLPEASPQALVEALVAKIPDPQKAIQLRRHLL
jgi:serine/threonine-protein kinase